MALPKVIIIGGGFGGLSAAQALKKAPVEVLLIDRANYHCFQPLLYEVATAVLSSADISSPIREILARQPNATVLLADIVKVEKEKQQVIAENGDRYPYDYLILSPGARHSYFNHPEWEPLAPGLKTLNDALAIRERIILSYERAERCHDHAEAVKFLRFVVIGGGPTGVEMAGAIAEIAHLSLVRNFRNIKPEETKIYLIEGKDQILPSYPKKLAIKAEDDLKKLGVEVLLNTYVTDIRADGVEIGDKFLESPNVIWAAGNQASPLLKTLAVPLDRNGLAIVNPDLSIPGYPNIFVIGDAAFCKDKNGNSLPGVAPVATQQGRYVAKLIKNKIPSTQRTPFRYLNKGMMATIGKNKAVAVVGNLNISGYFAWLAWCFIHILFLISFTNRFLVMLHWCYLYLFNQRRIRLITRPVSDFDDPLPKPKGEF